MPVEPIWAFYPKYFWEIASKHARLAYRWLQLRRITARVRSMPHAEAYTDLTLTAVDEPESDTLELFTQNDAARTEVARVRRIAELTNGTPRKTAIPVS